MISLLRLDVSQLITIGGDDTAYSAMRLEEKAGGRIRVVHVPKTIDNDLDLPPQVDTFGFQTARHHRRRDRQEPDGRRADHLALVLRHLDGPQGGSPRARHRQGGGRHPDPDPRGVLGPPDPPADDRRHPRRRDHQAPLLRPPRRRRGDRRRRGARTSTPTTSPSSRTSSATPTATCASPRSNIGEILKRAVQQRLAEFGIKTTVVAKNIGYELRCADPIPYRHGVHARPRLLRRQVPARRRRRGA